MKNRGFSLLELVITVGVLTTGIVFVLQAFSMAGKMTVVSADLTRAVFLAEDKLQELEFLEKTEGIETQERQKTGWLGKFRWQYQITDVEDLSLYLLTLKINWQRGIRFEEFSVGSYLR
ncbi:MAG: prepilin-type N-terminal cleavage/methylation domain-containing protein [Candidatus Omnitrophica bacterium]|nr:prepilin-type N-terminal cleavage/methylation domain-containing protein [Candidatus Omnitrophota bacterium]